MKTLLPGVAPAFALTLLKVVPRLTSIWLPPPSPPWGTNSGVGVVILPEKIVYEPSVVKYVRG